MSQDAFDSVFKTVNNVFGTEIVYTYDAGGSSTIKGVFDNAFVEINLVSTKKPVLKNVRLADLDAEPVEGDSISIGSVEYTVTGHEPDGQGTTILILEKV